MEFVISGTLFKVLIWFGIGIFGISIAVVLSNKRLSTLQRFLLCLGTFFVPIIGGLFAIVFVLFSARVKQIN